MWHANGRKCDSLLRYLVDSLQWKNIDERLLEFGAKLRNLRLGLPTNGMNPYVNFSSKHIS